MIRTSSSIILKYGRKNIIQRISTIITQKNSNTSTNIKINNNIINNYSAQQYRCLSTFNNGNHYEKNNNVLNFSSFASTMFVAVTGGIIYHQVFDNENNRISSESKQKYGFENTCGKYLKLYREVHQ